MFKYIFGISFKEYSTIHTDIKNGLFYLISLIIFIFIFGWWGILAWLIFLRLMSLGGSLIF